MKKLKFISLIVICTLLATNCKKDKEPTNPLTLFNPGITYGTMNDNCGNTYKTVQIGNQTWMAENLKTTKYRDGTSIPNIPVDNQWSIAGSGAYCWYNNDINNKATIGALYNWYAVDDSRKICPAGWHLPSDNEWATLTTYLGGEEVAGGKMKESGTSHWISPNVGADNSSGFTALPGGGRNMGGTFAFQGNTGFWWSSSTNGTMQAWTRYLDYNYAKASRYTDFQSSGFSVRCVKD